MRMKWPGNPSKPHDEASPRNSELDAFIESVAMMSGGRVEVARPSVTH